MADAHFPSTKSTIMVVDDEPELATIFRLMLERKGYSVRCAYSGPQLLAGLEEQKPDLIYLVESFLLTCTAAPTEPWPQCCERGTRAAACVHHMSMCLGSKEAWPLS